MKIGDQKCHFCGQIEFNFSTRDNLTDFRMPYTKATILETFRTAIILPMPGPRVATQDLTVGEYVIPKVANIMQLHIYMYYRLANSKFYN